MGAAAGWAVLALLVMAAVAVAFVTALRYQSRYDRSWLVMGVSGFTMLLAVICTLIVPVDSYFTSQGITSAYQAVQNTMSVCLLLLSAMLFIAVPFSYFFVEEGGVDRTRRQQVMSALKYMVAGVLLFTILLVLGFAISWNKGNDGNDQPNSHNWEHGLRNRARLLAVLSLTVLVLSVLGLISWMTYTAYGLAVMPISGFFGFRNASDELDSLRAGLQRSRFAEREASVRGGRRLQDNRATRETALLERQVEALEESSQLWYNRLWTRLRVLRLLVSLIGFAGALLVCAPIGMNAVYRMVKSPCGWSCGFGMETTDRGNAAAILLTPLDVILTWASRYFPLGYLLVACLVFLVFVASVHGLRRRGIRFIVFKLYRVAPGKTVPQGICLMAVNIVLICIGMIYLLFIMAPTFVQFGPQRAHGHGDWCRDINQDGCTKTIISELFRSGLDRFPIFSIILFVFEVGISVMFIWGMVRAIMKGRSTNVAELDSEEEDDALLAYEERQRHGGSRNSSRSSSGRGNARDTARGRRRNNGYEPI